MEQIANINCSKDSERYTFIVSVLGDPHTTAFNHGKTIAIWYVSQEDKKILEEMEKSENVQ